MCNLKIFPFSPCSRQMNNGQRQLEAELLTAASGWRRMIGVLRWVLRGRGAAAVSSYYELVQTEDGGWAAPP